MPTIQFTSAQLTRPDAGPESVVLVGTDQTGKTHDFELQLPRGHGEAYIRDLGFEKWLSREPGPLLVQRNGREYAGMVDVHVTADGARVILTKQAVGYDKAAAAKVLVAKGE